MPPQSIGMTAQSEALTAMMATMTQLSQTISAHIIKTDTGLASLQTEMNANLAVVRSDMDANKSEVAAVRSDLATLFDLVKNGERRKGRSNCGIG